MNLLKNPTETARSSGWNLIDKHQIKLFAELVILGLGRGILIWLFNLMSNGIEILIKNGGTTL